MNINTVERLATATTLLTVGLVAAAVWATSQSVGEADRERKTAGAIVRTMTEVRLVAFEFILDRRVRAHAQWKAASDRLDGLIADPVFAGGPERRVIGALRERKSRSDALFTELASPAAEPARDAPMDDTTRRYRRQLVSRLIIQHQDALGDAFRLSDLSAQRIDAAQRRANVVILSGLAIIAVSAAGASWMVNRRILAPVARLQRAALEIAGGARGVRLATEREDEIGGLARAFDKMTLALRDSADRIEGSNRELVALNGELEAFSYSVSHDLRAPLRSLDGFSLVLLEDYGDRLDAEGKDAIARIRAASQRMGGLIDDLLRLSRVTRTELKVERVDVSRMAREIAAALDATGGHAAVEWAIEEGLAVDADKALLRIALENLLQNAWKFTGKTERPSIRVGAQDAALFVADNGVGFDMAHAEHLFGAFRRLHSPADFPGTGIGLAIVERIVRRHRGRVWAWAEPGAGATFFFTLSRPGS